jgi:hypothetical protein
MPTSNARAARAPARQSSTPAESSPKEVADPCREVARRLGPGYRGIASLLEQQQRQRAQFARAFRPARLPTMGLARSTAAVLSSDAHLQRVTGLRALPTNQAGRLRDAARLVASPPFSRPGANGLSALLATRGVAEQLGGLRTRVDLSPWRPKTAASDGLSSLFAREVATAPRATVEVPDFDKAVREDKELEALSEIVAARRRAEEERQVNALHFLGQLVAAPRESNLRAEAAEAARSAAERHEREDGVRRDREERAERERRDHTAELEGRRRDRRERILAGATLVSTLAAVLALFHPFG